MQLARQRAERRAQSGIIRDDYLRTLGLLNARTARGSRQKALHLPATQIITMLEQRVERVMAFTTAAAYVCRHIIFDDNVAMYCLLPMLASVDPVIISDDRSFLDDPSDKEPV